MERTDRCRLLAQNWKKDCDLSFYSVAMIHSQMFSVNFEKIRDICTAERITGIFRIANEKMCKKWRVQPQRSWRTCSSKNPRFGGNSFQRWPLTQYKRQQPRTRSNLRFYSCQRENQLFTDFTNNFLHKLFVKLEFSTECNETIQCWWAVVRLLLRKRQLTVIVNKSFCVCCCYAI